MCTFYPKVPTGTGNSKTFAKFLNHSEAWPGLVGVFTCIQLNYMADSKLKIFSQLHFKPNNLLGVTLLGNGTLNKNRNVFL